AENLRKWPCDPRYVTRPRHAGAQHWAIWLRDPEGYTVVLSSPRWIGPLNLSDSSSPTLSVAQNGHSAEVPFGDFLYEDARIDRSGYRADRQYAWNAGRRHRFASLWEVKQRTTKSCRMDSDTGGRCHTRPVVVQGPD